MKKVCILIALLLTALVIFSACSKDVDEPSTSETSASTTASQVEEVDKDEENSDEEKLLPQSLGITIPNVNLGAVTDDRLLSEDEIREALRYGKTRAEAEKMTRHELTTLIDSQKLDAYSIEAIIEGNPELAEENLSEWTYAKYNEYVAEKNREKLTPSPDILRMLEERNITVEDFQYLFKFYEGDVDILAAKDDELKKHLEEYYLFKLDYAREASSDPFYSDLYASVEK